MATPDITVVVHQGDEDWSAVYINGELDRVGDHYLADERIRELFGVTTVQSNDFLRGQNYREGVAQTLTDIDEYRAAEDVCAREARIAELQRELDAAKSNLASATAG